MSSSFGYVLNGAGEVKSSEVKMITISFCEECGKKLYGVGNYRPPRFCPECGRLRALARQKIRRKIARENAKIPCELCGSLFVPRVDAETKICKPCRTKLQNSSVRLENKRGAEIDPQAQPHDWKKMKDDEDGFVQEAISFLVREHSAYMPDFGTPDMMRRKGMGWLMK